MSRRHSTQAPTPATGVLLPGGDSLSHLPCLTWRAR